MVCPACKGSGQAHYQRGLNSTPAIVEIRDCPDCNGTGCIPVPSTPASEGMLKFNNALEADALDWDTRNIESKFTSEEILGHIEVLSKSFYDKYAGKGLTPSEVMELHKSEYWELVINFIEAPLRAEIANLKKQLVDTGEIIERLLKCHQSEANIEEQLTEIVCSQYTRAEKAEAEIAELKAKIERLEGK